MADFEEFDQQGSVPARDMGSIISHAFEMYKGVFLYAILAMVIYFLASWLIQLVSGFDSMSFAEEMQSGGGYGNVDFWAVPGLTTYYGLSSLLGLFIAPLFVGLIYIINKYNNKEQIQVGDLFIGYRQNLLNIIIYTLIYDIVIAISAMLCVVPLFFVFPLFLLGYPILLFENANAIDAVKKSFEIAKENYGTFLGAGLLGALISISGIIACCIGIIATAFFLVAVMYSLYVAFVGKPKPLIEN